MGALAVPSARARVAPTGVAAAGAAYLVTVGAIDPYAERAVAGVALACPVHAVTGGFCPGCGSTRAVHELVHGDLVSSLVCHPLVLPLLALGLYLWVSWAVTTRAGRPRWARSPVELPAAIPMVVAVAFVTLTIVRNVPGLEWLTPPDAAP